MGKTVDVIIPVEAELAGKLADPAMRARVAAVVNHELRFDREAFVRELGSALKECQDAAREAGLTEEMIEAELAAYNAERRHE